MHQYAASHDGRFPDSTSEVSDTLWVVPGTAGKRYVYVRGRRASSGFDDEPHRRKGNPGLLAYEPEDVGPDRLVLLVEEIYPEILWMPASEVECRLHGEEP